MNDKDLLLSLIMSLPPQKQEQLWAELVARGIIREEDAKMRAYGS